MPSLPMLVATSTLDVPSLKRAIISCWRCKQHSNMRQQEHHQGTCTGHRGNTEQLLSLLLRLGFEPTDGSALSSAQASMNQARGCMLHSLICANEDPLCQKEALTIPSKHTHRVQTAQH